MSESNAERRRRLTVDLPDEQHRRLRVRCAERGETMSNVVRDMLDRELSALIAAARKDDDR